jgi:acetyl esterase/lipase
MAAGTDARVVRMATQWILPGLGLAVVAVTAAALVPPGRRLFAGNKAWFALAWFGSEFAPWLAACVLAGVVLVARQAVRDGSDPTEFAALLLLVSLAGLLIVHLRARRAGAVLESALQAELGSAYAEGIEHTRRRRVCKGPAAPQLLLPLPLRRAVGVERIADVPYPGGHERNTLDVYRPARGCHAAPVLLQLHGGNWVAGDRRRQSLPLVHHLASLGWLVVAANYRLGPSVRLPAHLIDCKSALAWIRGHAAALGGDPGFVAVTGGGAGAHLAALLALTFDRQDLQPGFEHVDTRPAACVALHGVYDLADRSRHFAARRKRMRWLCTHVMPGTAAEDLGAWDLVSPVARVRADAPPFFVLHGTHDSLSPVAGAREFVRHLREVSPQPVVYGELPGAQHAWDTAVSHRSLQTAHAVARFLEWCAGRHYRLHGPYRDSTDRAWS